MYMAESDLTLIGAWSSPFVLRAQIALNIKNLQYVFHEEKLANKSELLLKSNPVDKKIPVLIHSDEPICESLIIVEYIDETWSSSGPSILPSDPYDRAIARFWAAYVDDKFFPSLKSIAASPADEEVERAAAEHVITGLSILEKAHGEISKGKSFFVGAHIGCFHIAFGSLLGWMKVIDKLNGLNLIHPERTPLLAHSANKFSPNPAVSGVLPNTEKRCEFPVFLT